MRRGLLGAGILLLTCQFCVFGDDSVEAPPKTVECETCQVISLTLHEAVASNIDEAVMVTKKKKKMSHTGLVTAVLDSPICAGFVAMHGYIARRAKLDVNKMAKFCVRLMDDRRDDFETALLSPKTNATSRLLSEAVCLQNTKRRKAYCKELWTAKETPVPKSVTDRLSKENGRLAEAFFARIKDMKDVTPLAEGLYEKILRRGEGTEKPATDTTVVVHYTGKLADCEMQPGPEPCKGGTEFDATYWEDGHTKGGPARFSAKVAKSFWWHALPRMVAGDRREYYVPYALAYGANDDPDNRAEKVGPNASLIFQVELMEVHGKSSDKAAKASAASGDGDWKAIDGVKTKYRVLKEGKKGGSVEVGDTVTVHATGIVQETGKKFWSTKDPGQEPFTYTAGGGVIQGWDMGARGMQLGEVRMLNIPADEGYGAGGFPSWGIPPNGGLNFELEVLELKAKNGKDKSEL